MALNRNQKSMIEKTIADCLFRKLSSYKPETKSMSYQDRLIGRDRMVLYSIFQFLNDAFDVSFFEPIAMELTIASNMYVRVEKQHIVGDQISEAAQREIKSIIDDLSINGEPDKMQEIERIRRVCRTGRIVFKESQEVDLYLEGINGEKFLFDLKTLKSDESNFKDSKRSILEWVAICLYNNPEEVISTYIAIPYNPYEPKPYEKWILRGMFDFEQELKVAHEFWDFIGGKGAYEDLLDCFERVGLAMRGEIDEYFKRFYSNIDD